MNKIKSPGVILFFIDGLGIGEPNENNPLYFVGNIQPLDNFKDIASKIIFDGILKSTDTRLEIEGRPQSASGQTTILTGINAPKFLGYHKQGFPNKALLEIINRGEWTLSGFRNRDIRSALYPSKSDPTQQRRQSGRVTRALARLRAHAIIKKVGGSYRYQLTSQGRRIVTALLAARQADVEKLMALAA